MNFLKKILQGHSYLSGIFVEDFTEIYNNEEKNLKIQIKQMKRE